MKKFSLLLLFAIATVGRATTLIYPVEAVDDLWNLPADDFKQKYGGINITGLGPSDEGWYVRYRHENLTYMFGPIANRDDAQKKKWDLEAVRDAAIRNRPSLGSSQVDFVKFTYSGVYGKGGGNTPYTGKKGDGKDGAGSGDDPNGDGKGGAGGKDGTGKDGNGNGNGNGMGDGSGNGTDGNGGRGAKLASLNGNGSGDGSENGDGSGDQAGGQNGANGSLAGGQNGSGTDGSGSSSGGQSGSGGQGGQQGGFVDSPGSTPSIQARRAGRQGQARL